MKLPERTYQNLDSDTLKRLALFEASDLLAVFSLLFHPVEGVLDAWKKAGRSSADAATVRMARRRAAAYGAAFVVLLLCAGAGAMHLTGYTSACDLTAVAVATGVALDLVAEWRFRRLHGSIEPIWPAESVYASDARIEALAARGIPALGRAERYRSLWHFFAPFAPIEIMVPADRAREAREALAGFAQEGQA